MDLPRTAAVTALTAVWTVASAAAGQVRGTVSLDGPLPEPTILSITSGSSAHPVEGCGGPTKRSPRLLVDASGGIQNAVVWLELPAVTPQAGASATVVLDQRTCVFEPHVLVVPAASVLVIRNSDAVFHNLRIFRDDTMVLNEWQKPQAADLQWRFNEPGRYLVRCGVHSWMHAWLIAAEHPHYSVTDGMGQFLLRGISEGRHTLHVWHETLGEHQREIDVGAEASTVVIRFPARSRTP